MWLDACGNVVIAALGLVIWGSRETENYSSGTVCSGQAGMQIFGYVYTQIFRCAVTVAGRLQGILYAKGRYDV